MVTDEDIYEYLEHHGIKGMRWGVRKQQSSSNESNKSEGMSTKKKVAIGLGSAALAAGIIAGGIYAKKHFGTSTSSIKDVSSGKKLAESLIQEPTSIIHSSRGHSKGFHFLERGGLNNPLLERDIAKVSDSTPIGTFKRYGNNLEKAFVSFHDPLGRRDAAGRVIPHEVFLPKHLADGVNTHEEAVKVAWPLLKDKFDAMYKATTKKYI